MSLPGVLSVLHLQSTESTQKLARAMAEDGAENGTLVRADRQTRGRGRLSRRWSSPVGGLYFSLILRPSFAPERLAELSLTSAEAAARALAGLAKIKTTVKPPNDVYVETPAGPRKLCGILAEASGGARGLDWLVVGIGVNVNAAPHSARATSLKSLTGRDWDLDQVLAAVLGGLAAAYRAKKLI